MTNPIKSLLESRVGSLSSKRFCGITGWIVLLGCYIWSTVTGRPLPGMTDEFILGAVTLLGVDSVTGIWKNKKKPGPPAPPTEDTTPPPYAE
nr:MAG TPA: hypothetical protein [Caudoviricetes sp.]